MDDQERPAGLMLLIGDATAAAQQMKVVKAPPFAIRIARFGGAEFVVLAMDSGAQDPGSVLRRLQAQCARRNLQADAPYQLFMSVGDARAVLLTRGAAGASRCADI